MKGEGARARGRFVGFGFGPIQAGLMLLAAMDSGAFDAYCVVEIDAELVAAVRRNGEAVTVNIAGRDGISRRRLAGLRILNPRVPEDRAAAEKEIRAASEMATAIPSVSYYGSGGESSIAALIARAADPQRAQIVYAAENNNHAAGLLRDEILRHVAEDRLAGLDILDTVIGKMSGVIQGSDEMERLGIEPMVPGWSRAILVEEFSRILVSSPRLPGSRRGITVFEEKEDLLPFEEAKLYGHNAVHSLLGYLAAWKGYDVMSRIREDRSLYELGLEAFVEESGGPLIRRHGGLGDPLFTPEGYAAYARDLLERMTNPYLHDRVERICRDPARKLGFDDRLIGTMRLALEAGRTPRRLALGAAAAVRYARLRGEQPLVGAGDTASALRALWRQGGGEGEAAVDSPVAAECLLLIAEAERSLQGGGSPA